MFHSYLQASRKRTNETLVGGVSLTAALFGTPAEEDPQQTTGKISNKKAKGKDKKDKKKSKKKDKKASKKKKKKGSKKKKSSSSSSSSSASSSSSGSSSESSNAKKSKKKKSKRGEIIPLAPPKVQIDDDQPNQYYMNTEELGRQEGAAKMRAEKLRRSEEIAAEKKQDAIRRAEEWDSQLREDPSSVRDAALELIEGSVGDEAKPPKGQRGLPLRAFTRQKVLSWIWAGENQEYIGGGEDGPEDSLG